MKGLVAVHTPPSRTSAAPLVFQLHPRPPSGSDGFDCCAMMLFECISGLSFSSDAA